MAQDPKKNKSQPAVNTGVSKYTFNTDGTQTSSVPSVTKLLLRSKYLGAEKSESLIKKPEKKPEPSPEPQAPPPPVAPPEAQALAPQEPALPPTPGRRKNANKISGLAQWNANAPIPPIARAMIEKGIASLLFLSSNGGAPATATYTATAGYQLGPRRQKLCVGIQLSSSITPDLWERVFKSQFVELNTQPSTESVHFLRQILGAEDNEWVLLVKSSNGPEQGILIIYSKTSVAADLNVQLGGAPPPIPGPGSANGPTKKRTGKTGLFKRAA